MKGSSPPTLVFYEKPGCINNRKQKGLLRKAGFSLDVRNLLTTAWQPEQLKEFFHGLPLEKWFNTSAPQIKHGEMQPTEMSEQQALEAMVLNPILIRRPLISCDKQHWVGFDLAGMLADLNLDSCGVPEVPEDIETCARPNTGKSCSSVKVGTG